MEGIGFVLLNIKLAGMQQGQGKKAVCMQEVVTSTPEKKENWWLFSADGHNCH